MEVSEQFWVILTADFNCKEKDRRLHECSALMLWHMRPQEFISQVHIPGSFTVSLDVRLTLTSSKPNVISLLVN